MLSFSPDALDSFLAGYAAAIWPAQLAAFLLAASALALAARGGSAAARLVPAALAAFWLWTGLVFHLRHFAMLHFAAFAFGWIFALQGGLLLLAALRGHTAWRFRPDGFGWAGLALALYALLAPPLLLAPPGLSPPEAALAGLVPLPTALLTLALVLLAAGRAPLRLAAIPLLWCLAEGWAAWQVGMAADLASAGLGIAAASALAIRNWRVSRAVPRG